MTLRLATLEPATIGSTIAALVTAQLHRLAFAAGMHAEPDGPSQIGLTGIMLCGYAQRGLAAVDWPDDECALDAIQSVCESLYSQAGEPRTFGVGALERLDALPEGALGSPVALVLIAAYGRHRIATGQSVSAAELAALAGLTTRQVRSLASSGELEATGERVWRVRARDARRWLAARGVEGFE